MNRSWRIGRVVLVLACTGALAVAGVRLLLDPWLLSRAEARLTARVGAPVTVGSARLRYPSRIALRDVRSARGSAREALVDLSLSALLLIEERVTRVDAVDVAFFGHGTAARVLLSRDADGRERLRIEGARHERLPVSAASVLVELDDNHAPRTIEVHGGGWDGVTAIEGRAAREADVWTGRLAWPGLRATLKATTGERVAFDGEAYLDDAPLPARPLTWLDLGHARASGTLRLDGWLDDARLQLGLSARGVTLDHPAIASAPAAWLDASITGALAVSGLGRRFESDRLELRSGAFALLMAGRVDRDGTSAITVDVPRAPCSGVLAALEPLLPALDGLALTGELAAHVAASADARHLAGLVLETDLEIGCEVVRDAPAADPGRLALLRTIAAVAAFGDGEVRPLDDVGVAVVRALVLGEDAKFFRHRGFDPWTIRRALAADLEAWAFVRGASTITQQLARNLFLDADRTLSRKLEEAIIAWRLEQVVPKRAILEAWLFAVEMGPDVRGVVDGARYWFGKDVSTLDDDEAAHLAALVPAPRRGMDDAWARRYRDLKVKLATSRLEIPR